MAVRGIVTPVPVKFTLPLTVPVDCGVNSTLKVKLWFGCRETGRFSPLMVKPAPVVCSCENVREYRPELVSTTGSVEVDPKETLPKPKEVGLGVKNRFAPPLPEASVQNELAENLLTMEIASTSSPVVVGVNATVKLTLFPGAMVTGRLKPETSNASSPEFNPDIVRLVGPELFSTTGMLLLWPITTLPNRKPAGEQVSCGVAEAAALCSRTDRTRRVMVTSGEKRASEYEDAAGEGRITP